MFKTTIDNKEKFFETADLAIEYIKNTFTSETCLFQKVTNWTSITKAGNRSCQVAFIKIENNAPKSFSKSILWINAREDKKKEEIKWCKEFGEEWEETRKKILEKF